MVIIFIAQLVLGILAFVVIKKNENDQYVILHKELERVYESSFQPEYLREINNIQKDVSIIKILKLVLVVLFLVEIRNKRKQNS